MLDKKGNRVYHSYMGTMLIKNMPDDVRKAFKMLCLQRDTPMREEIIRLMKEEVEKAKRKRE